VTRGNKMGCSKGDGSVTGRARAEENWSKSDSLKGDG
jgi:hypothetical protein